MPLFDELPELGKPGDGARFAMQREFERRRSTWTRTGYHYRGAGDLLLQHGQFFKGRPLPDQYEVGEPNHCFMNALEAAEADPSLRYYEGVYASGTGHFTTHGWVVDADGVCEVTMPTRPDELAKYVDYHSNMQYLPAEHWTYWGVEFSPALIRWHWENLSLPLIDRSHGDAEASGGLDMSEDHDFPILKVPYDRNRVSL